MKNNKRVIQISLDVVVGSECDGFNFADEIADELEKHGYRVVGAGFQEDMTELYKENFSNLLEV
jgi:ribose 5-phosphate isomerase RpiB